MKVTYLGHSGFLVQTEKAYYLFDVIRGKLPELEMNLPLYVFVSHSHADHFSEEIFAPMIAQRAAVYLLSDDIQKRYRKEKPPWYELYASKIRWVKSRETIRLETGLLKTLKSTDIGVAFAFYEDDGAHIYHAGDLNWWYWKEEPKDWNRNMEVNFKREIDLLRDADFDVAFLPLDPRQEEAYDYGMKYFLENISVQHVFPMHFWENYCVISRFLEEHGNPAEWKNKKVTIHVIEREEQIYEI